MTPRLFHTTEFAESDLLSPQTQREAKHPLTLVWLSSLWLVVAGNLPLWLSISALPLGGLPLSWLGLRLGLMMLCALTALLSLMCWRSTLKPILMLALLLAAVNTPLMLYQAGCVDWQGGWSQLGSQLQSVPRVPLLGLFSLLGLLPVLWLWRQPVRRIAWRLRVQQTLSVCVLALVSLGVIGWLSLTDVGSWMRSQPEWQELLNPFNSLHLSVPAPLAERLPR